MKFLDLTTGDSCAVASPPPPCLAYVGETMATQPDNAALWGIFLVGLVAGLALAFVLTAPAAYQLGKKEGWQSAHSLKPRKHRTNYQHAARRR